MQGMRRIGGDLCIAARRVQALAGHFGVVASVNQIVSYAGMIRLLLQ